MRIFSLVSKWGISQEDLVSTLKNYDQSFDTGSDEISETQFVLLVMHYGKETIIDMEKEISLYSFTVKYRQQFYIIRKQDNTLLSVNDTKMFTSVIISQNTTPCLLTINCYAIREGYSRGIVAITNEGNLEEVCPIDKKYDFIDGVDRGLARVKKNEKWGIISYSMPQNSFETVCPVVYDNLWNFYGKGWNHVRAEKDGTSYDINLVELNKESEVVSDSVNISWETEMKKKIEAGLMQVRNITIENFKFFDEQTTIELRKPINIIVGKNNSGKSSCLKAIQLSALFFGRGDIFGLATEKFANLHYKNDETGKMILATQVGSCEFIAEFMESCIPQSIQIKHYSKNCNIHITKDCFIFNNKTESIKMDLDGKWNCMEESESEEQQPNIFTLINKFKLNNSTVIAWEKDQGNSLNAISEMQMNLERLTNIIHLSVFSVKISEETNSIFSDFSSKERIAHSFVRRWIRKMDIGDDYILLKDNINDMLIIDEFGEESRLSEMGTGSIHFVLLLLRVATKIFVSQTQSSIREDGFFSPIILIEEPEQNLHPKLQTVLADFLVDASEEYIKNNQGIKNITIIVETHSEYLVRNTQVIARLRGEENPFSITYFPSKNDGISPYPMHYRENGTLEPDFMTGFTDESFKLTLKLY